MRTSTTMRVVFIVALLGYCGLSQGTSIHAAKNERSMNLLANIASAGAMISKGLLHDVAVSDHARNTPSSPADDAVHVTMQDTQNRRVIGNKKRTIVMPKHDPKDARELPLNTPAIDGRYFDRYKRRRVLSSLDSPLRRLPDFVDELLESAVHSLDRVASGFQIGFSAPTIDFAREEDGSHLVVRIFLPHESHDYSHQMSPNTLHAIVIGHSHLRIRLELQHGDFSSVSTHTIALPAKVSKEGVEIHPKQDGSIHVSLRIVSNTSSSAEVREGADNFENKGFPSLFGDVQPRSLFEDADVRYELPTGFDIGICRDKYHGEKLLISKCMCDTVLDERNRAICYGSFIAKCVGIARRAGIDEDATTLKHEAIECAAVREDKVGCLEKIATAILKTFYRDASESGEANYTEQIRRVIESDDDDPSYFQPVRVTGVTSPLLLVSLLLLLGVVLLIRRFCIQSFGRNITQHQLSSVLIQRTERQELSRTDSGRKSLGSSTARENHGRKCSSMASSSKLA